MKPGINFRKASKIKGTPFKAKDLIMVTIMYTKDGPEIKLLNGTKVEGATIALPPGMFITLEKPFIGYLIKAGEGPGHVIPLSGQLGDILNETRILNDAKPR